MNHPIHKHASFKGAIGVAQADITPPVGIYLGNWGAAKSDTAIGVHRPLYLTCITFQSAPGQPPLVLIAADLGWWKNMEDENFLRHKILEACSLQPSQLLFCLSHTHAGPGLCTLDKEKPGGEHIAAYLVRVRETAINAIRESLSNAVPATLQWQYGKCGLAANRDLNDVEGNQVLVGFNPQETAEDTLLVGRITNEKGNVIATIVNYACHPTTLGWDNLLISPDYIGAMRETVQSITGAPCLFLQGASGELAPAEQYTGQVSIADQHGRQLGYAVLGVLESMLPPGTALSFHGIVESGASLAIWARSKSASSTTLLAKVVDLSLPLKELPAMEEIEKAWTETKDPVQKERLWRKLNIRRAVGNGSTANAPLWIWQLGESVLIAQPNEAYSIFQQILRKTFAGHAVAVMNLVNGHTGYLPPAPLYNKSAYPVWQTPFAAGALEKLIKTAIDETMKMIHH